MTRIQFAVIYVAAMFVILALAYIVDDTVERRGKELLELHKCREFIVLGKDTVEVIYTKHEYRHYKMLTKKQRDGIAQSIK